MNAPTRSVIEKPAHRPVTRAGEIILVGNPNAGKTTLFNQLTGLRLKTANFPGTTLDVRQGIVTRGGRHYKVVDLPGLYSLTAVASEERLALDAILGSAGRAEHPSVLVLIVDATNLVRNLFLAGQVLELRIPTVVALNMTDLARKSGIDIDAGCLSRHLGCPVVPVAARKGEGIEALLEACDAALEGRRPPETPLLLRGRGEVSHAERYDWAESVAESCVSDRSGGPGRASEFVDAVLMHPVGGIAAFAGILFGVFYLIFSFATVPMDWIDAEVGAFGTWLASVMPDGLIEGLIVDGVIAGVGGVLVFLPQICILFFCLSLLEDTGYLARAACVMDRLLRRVGLPGKAFVPILSAHACAIPAIMSARVIESREDRLTTILVLPLMTCSARLPVYAMVTGLLFPADPFRAALVFTGAYALGITAAMTMAFVFRRTLVRGPIQPLMLELPNYKMPSLKTALLAAYDRGRVFVRKAGTVILAISIVLWWLMTFPTLDESAMNASELATEAAKQQAALEHSFAGRLGHVIEPAIEPLGFDWKIGVAIIASFAAREVVVSALSVIYGVGEEGAESQSVLLDKLRAATGADGAPVFTFATCVSLLVFYVLAMQCLPTQAVTRRETGSWKWAAFQLLYMTALAYSAALLAYQSLTFFGVA